MTVKEHYDNHLGNFYSWMCGDFTEKLDEQLHFFTGHNIFPQQNKKAIDLGSGHGPQAISLAQLGFSVTAVDFNKNLISELKERKGELDITCVEAELLHFIESTAEEVELIVCMGDTLTHLESADHVKKLADSFYQRLLPGGKVILTFRELTQELTGTQRFIPVRSDETKMLTCFLEYHPDHVIVYDIFSEKIDGNWTQKVSSYPKLRLSEKSVKEILVTRGFRIISASQSNRMTCLIAERC